MKKKIIQARQLSKTFNDLIKKRELLLENFEDFQKKLAEYPEMGDLIPGTGGLRKTRLKSASRGQSGSFRICYYFFKREN